MIYVVEATTEEGLSEDSVTFADLFYHDSEDVTFADSTMTLMTTSPHWDPQA